MNDPAETMARRVVANIAEIMDKLADGDDVAHDEAGHLIARFWAHRVVELVMVAGGPHVKITVISNKENADVQYRNWGASEWKYLVLGEEEQRQVDAFGEYHWPDDWEDYPRLDW